MTDERARAPFLERLTEPLSRAELLAILFMDVVTVVGVFTGVLGVAWYVVTPTVLFWSVHCLFKAFEKTPVPPRPRQTAAASR